MKKLSKTEKIKRLRWIKKELKNGDKFMCHLYWRFGNNLFKEIPELYKFKPQTKGFKNAFIDYGKHTAWVWEKGETAIKKLQAIDKAIKLIKSK